MRQLVLYEGYTCKDIQEIFDPDITAPTEGDEAQCPDIIGVPYRRGDYLFLVTLDGSNEAERITTDGVLSWQVDLQHAPASLADLSHSDETAHAGYIFLRTRSGSRYTYIGRGRYLAHDPLDGQIVRFHWLIHEWRIPQEVLLRMGLDLAPGVPADTVRTPMLKSHLRVTPPPGREPRTPPEAEALPDFNALNEKDRQRLNQAGQLVVIAHEKRCLVAAGRADLAHRIRHTSAIEGRFAPYDVASFQPDGSRKFITVKTTRGAIDTPFTLANNQHAFSHQQAQNWHLYRIYHFNNSINAGKVYILPGPLEDSLAARPVVFRFEP